MRLIFAPLTKTLNHLKNKTMQHLKNLTAALIIMTAVASCKKERISNSGPQTPAEKKMTEYTWVFDNGTPTTNFYEYDHSGRLITQKTINTICYFNYIGVDQLVITEKKTSDNSLRGTYECTLNNKGAITNMVFKNAANVVQTIHEMSYTSSGYLKKIKEASTNAVYEEEFEFVNDMPVSSKVYYDGVLYYSRQYFYDETQQNKTPVSHWYDWPSKTLFGNIYKYKLIEYKSLKADGSLHWHTKTLHETDANGFTLKETTDFLHLNKKGVGTYVYQ
jgi:hypothetical protein